MNVGDVKCSTCGGWGGCLGHLCPSCQGSGTQPDMASGTQPDMASVEADLAENAEYLNDGLIDACD